MSEPRKWTEEEEKLALEKIQADLDEYSKKIQSDVGGPTTPDEHLQNLKNVNDLYAYKFSEFWRTEDRISDRDDIKYVNFKKDIYEQIYKRAVEKSKTERDPIKQNKIRDNYIQNGLVVVFGLEAEVSKTLLLKDKPIGWNKTVADRLLKLDANTIISDMEEIAKSPEKRKAFYNWNDAVVHTLFKRKTYAIAPDPEEIGIKGLKIEAGKKQGEEVAKLAKMYEDQSVSETVSNLGAQLLALHEKHNVGAKKVIDDIPSHFQEDAKSALEKINALVENQKTLADVWLKNKINLTSDPTNKEFLEQTAKIEFGIKQINAQLAGYTEALSRMTSTRTELPLPETVKTHLMGAWKSQKPAVRNEKGMRIQKEREEWAWDDIKDDIPTLFPTHWSETNDPNVDVQYKNILIETGFKEHSPGNQDTGLTFREAAHNQVLSEYRARVMELEKIPKDKLTEKETQELRKAQQITDLNLGLGYDYIKAKELPKGQSVLLEKGMDWATDIVTDLRETFVAPIEPALTFSGFIAKTKAEVEFEEKVRKAARERYLAAQADEVNMVFDSQSMQDLIYNADSVYDLAKHEAFKNLTPKDMPAYLRDRFNPTAWVYDEQGKASIESVQKQDWMNKPFSQLIDDPQIGTQIQIEDFQQWVIVRNAHKETFFKDLQDIMMDYGMDLTFDPNSGTVTYRPGTLLTTLDVGSALIPRLIMETPLGVTPAAIDYTLQKASGTGAFKYEGVRDFTNTGYSSRVLANIAYGDPGGMGDFSQIISGFQDSDGNQIYDEGTQLYQMAKWFGIGYDFMVPFEKYAFNTIGTVGHSAGRARRALPQSFGGVGTFPRSVRDKGYGAKGAYILFGEGDFYLNIADAFAFFPGSFNPDHGDFSTVNVTRFWQKNRKAFDQERRRREILKGNIKITDRDMLATYDLHRTMAEKGEDPYILNLEGYKGPDAEDLRRRVAQEKELHMRTAADTIGMSYEKFTNLIKNRRQSHKLENKSIADALYVQQIQDPIWVRDLSLDHPYHTSHRKFLKDQIDLNVMSSDSGTILKHFEHRFAETMFPDNPALYYNAQRYIVDSDVAIKLADKPTRALDEIIATELREGFLEVGLGRTQSAYKRLATAIEAFPETQRRLAHAGVEAMANTSEEAIAGIPADKKLQELIGHKLEPETNDSLSKIAQPLIIEPRQTYGQAFKNATAEGFIEKHIPKEQQNDFKKQILAELPKSEKTKIYTVHTGNDLPINGSFIKTSEAKFGGRLAERKTVAVKEEVKAEDLIFEELTPEEEVLRGKKILVVDEMFGGWVSNIAKLKETDSLFFDLFQRKQVAFSLLNMARKNNFHGVTFKLGNDGVFRQFYGKGQSLDPKEQRPGNKNLSSLDKAFVAALQEYSDNVKVTDKEVTVRIEPTYQDKTNNKNQSIVKLLPHIPSKMPEYVGEEGLFQLEDESTIPFRSTFIELWSSNNKLAMRFNTLLDSLIFDLDGLKILSTGDVTTPVPSAGLKITETIVNNKAQYAIGPEDSAIVFNGEFVNNTPMLQTPKGLKDGYSRIRKAEKRTTGQTIKRT